MASAFIGHTGFVGGNLVRQAPFQALFNSRNIEQIAGRDFDLLLVSGMPGTKWIANADPAEDRRILARLASCLRQVSARQIVLISTVNVYPTPIGVDEQTPIDATRQQPYGHHRFLLEQEVSARFPRLLIVRLLADLGLEQADMEQAFIEHDIGRHGLAVLARDGRRQARRFYHFAKAAYPRPAARNWKVRALEVLLMLGPLGEAAARVAYGRRLAKLSREENQAGLDSRGA